MIKAKEVLKDKFWIVEENGSKVGTLSAAEECYTYSCGAGTQVFGDFNRSESDKVTSGINSEFSEIFWFYPSANATENDKYVIYNYGEKVWYFGSLARTAWLDRGTRSNPLAAGSQYIFNHEIGFDDGGSAMNSFTE